MLIAALCAFAVAATAGLFLAFRHFTRKKLPASIALLHGLGGATGFLFVLLVVVQDPDFRLARQALYLFMVTILLGAVNLLFHLRKKRHRASLIVLHAAVAVSGVLTLIVAIFSGESSATAQPVATQAPVVAPAPAPPLGDAPKVAQPGESAAPALAASAPPVAEPAAPASAKQLSMDASVGEALGQSIRFETKSAAIAAESQAAVVAIAEALKAHPEVALVEVQGHADERGDDSQNVSLTHGRAAAVVEALVAHGVERARLHAAGYGARCPADLACRSANAPDSCHLPARHASDRRVVFVPLRVGTTSLAGEVVCAHGAELIPPSDRAFHVP